jgi:hypothetical protein
MIRPIESRRATAATILFFAAMLFALSSCVDTYAPVPEASELRATPPVAAPALLSAYLGAVNQPQIPFCPGGPVGTVEGLPVVVSRQLYNPSVVASRFAVTNSLGATTQPTCVTLAPANEENEDNTILLVGDFVPRTQVTVVAVAITGTVLVEGDSDTAPGPSLQGMTITQVAGVGESVRLVQAVVAGSSVSEIGATNGCPSSTAQVVRATWSGGIRLTNPPANVLANISVADVAGAPIPLLGVSAAEEQDKDNILDICLSSSAVPARLSIAAMTYLAPNGIENQSTAIGITP